MRINHEFFIREPRALKNERYSFKASCIERLEIATSLETSLFWRVNYSSIQTLTRNTCIAHKGTCPWDRKMEFSVQIRCLLYKMRNV